VLLKSQVTYCAIQLQGRGAKPLPDQLFVRHCGKLGAGVLVRDAILEGAMDDLEVCEILRAALEVLKTQVVYVRRTHESYLALYDALKKDLPNLQSNLQAEMETIRDVPEVQSHLAAIDELLQRLA
jgi:hypothetical protein